MIVISSTLLIFLKTLKPSKTLNMDYKYDIVSFLYIDNIQRQNCDMKVSMYKLKYMNSNHNRTWHKTLELKYFLFTDDEINIERWIKATRLKSRPPTLRSLSIQYNTPKHFNSIIFLEPLWKPFLPFTRGQRALVSALIHTNRVSK